MEGNTSMEAFREVNLSDGKCNVSLYVCEEEEKKIDQDPEYASELFKAALEGRLPSACDESEGSDIASEDKNKINQNGSDEIEWDAKLTQLFVDLCQKNTKWIPLNKAGTRKQLFQKVKQDLLEEGYSVSLESVREKFNSLVNAYRRAKLKAKQEGVVKTKWQYFDVFDEIMKTYEYGKLTHKNNAGKVKNANLPEVKSEVDSDSIDDPGDPSPSPSRNKLGNSVAVSHGSSPENAKKQGPTNKNFPKTLTANPVSRKRKRNELGSSGSKGSSSGSSNHMKGMEHIIVGGEGFSHGATLVFIDCIKRHKDMLKMRKTTEMFMRIRKEMTSEGFSFTEAKLRKKWTNLLISYRRILERANETGDLVSAWPYYEAIDSIIIDTKDLVEKRREENKYGDSPKASTSKFSECDNESKLGSNRILGGSPRKGYPMDDLLRLNNHSFDDDRGEHDRDFQRSLFEEWKNREARREERDQVKLEVLRDIKKSVNLMINKQDELMKLLKSMK